MEEGRRKAEAVVDGRRRVGRAREQEGAMYKSTSVYQHAFSFGHDHDDDQDNKEVTTTTVVCQAAFPFTSHVLSLVWTLQI